jgi:hypothetical protein
MKTHRVVELIRIAISVECSLLESFGLVARTRPTEPTPAFLLAVTVVAAPRAAFRPDGSSQSDPSCRTCSDPHSAVCLPCQQAVNGHIRR